MSVCTFFGHRDAPKEIEPILRSTLIDLIENKHVNSFYVGNHGCFDHMVRKLLKSLNVDYPYIHYTVVLAYMPSKRSEFDYEDYSDTIYPKGFEKTPPKYAISKRNEWMLNQSDYVVTYVKYMIGGAAQFQEQAIKKGKIVLNLADIDPILKNQSKCVFCSPHPTSPKLGHLLRWRRRTE